MNDMSSVYIVTSGEYSSYGISSVWSTREAAEEAARGYGTVEEWLLDTDIDRGVVQWHAWVVPATGEIRVGDRAETTNNPSPTEVTAPGYRYSYGERTTVWTGHGYGPSPEHARKSLSDAIAKAKAELLEETDG